MFRQRTRELSCRGRETPTGVESVSPKLGSNKHGTDTTPSISLFRLTAADGSTANTHESLRGRSVRILGEFSGRFVKPKAVPTMETAGRPGQCVEYAMMVSHDPGQSGRNPACV